VLVCSSGQFKGVIRGNLVCSDCPEGTFSKSDGDICVTDCTLCEKGTYQAERGKASCDSCPQGTIANRHGAEVCNTCPKGTFTMLAGNNTACSLCPAGTYSSTVGAGSPATCLPCPSGTWTYSKGSFSADACKPCKPGSFSSGFFPCTPCYPSTYQDKPRASECKPCNKPGDCQPAAGATSCAQCD